MRIYSSRIPFLIFELNEEEGEDCDEKVLNLCENELGIQVCRDELDRAHRVGRPREAEAGSEDPPPRVIIMKLPK